MILTYDQLEQTLECIKSIQAVKPRDFPDKQIFIVHNGSDPEVIKDLHNRFPRFHHVVQKDNEGFSVGANVGLRAAFALQPWCLFLTQDTSLVHFPKAAPFEPCIAAVKIYKRKLEVINAIGGAADLELAKHYYCTKAEYFWNVFESSVLQPFVPRTAFWIHQDAFNKVNGFDETLGSMWEDVDFSLRLREEGVLLQLDESTEVIHHRKGVCRREPVYTRFLYNRNRFAISRRALRSRGQQILFEIGIFFEWLGLVVKTLFKRPRELRFVWLGYKTSFSRPLVPPHLILAGKPVETKDETGIESQAVVDETAGKASKNPGSGDDDVREKTKSKIKNASSENTKTGSAKTKTSKGTATQTELTDSSQETSKKSAK